MSELSATNKIRLAETPPSACASCFGQYPTREHVDFGASYDGGVVEGETGIANQSQVAIDDLVICDECLCAAAALIGWRDRADTNAELARLQQQVDDLRLRVAGAVEYIKKADAEVDARQTLEQVFTPKQQPRKTAAK